MKCMKLWKSNLCSCCLQVPETTAIPIYICPHPSIAAKRENYFKNILGWLEKANTDPNLHNVIYSLWYGQQPNIEKEDPQELVKLWNTMQDLGTQSMWMG